jgi:hypothetical protein
MAHFEIFCYHRIGIDTEKYIFAVDTFPRDFSHGHLDTLNEKQKTKFPHTFREGIV